MSKNCALCGVQWKATSSDIWGPSISSLNEMPIKTEAHTFKPFKEAAADYADKYIFSFGIFFIVVKYDTGNDLHQIEPSPVGCTIKKTLKINFCFCNILP